MRRRRYKPRASLAGGLQPLTGTTSGMSKRSPWLAPFTRLTLSAPTAWAEIEDTKTTTRLGSLGASPVSTGEITPRRQCQRLLVRGQGHRGHHRRRRWRHGRQFFGRRLVDVDGQTLVGGQAGAGGDQT